MSWPLALYTIEIGLIYGLIAVGVYLTLRIIDFPDLTINNSFTLGAAVSITMIISGYNPVIATISSCIAGGLAGACTAFLNLQCRVQNLLASIISMIALYSINLRIMGKPNLVILEQLVIYDGFDSIVLTVSVVACITLIMTYFLYSEIGLGIRASGQNPMMAGAYGVDHNKVIYSALILSNALIALAGSMIAQLQGFCDIGMGNGVIVIGLASVIVGERIISSKKLVWLIVGCVLGAIFYNSLMAIALSTASNVLMASDVYLITAVFIVAIMLSNKAAGWK